MQSRFKPEVEAQIVETIKSLKGAPWAEILKTLNDKGFTTAMGKPWTKPNLSNFMASRKKQIRGVTVKIAKKAVVKETEDLSTSKVDSFIASMTEKQKVTMVTAYMNS